jgi:hypothetical protein
MGESVPPLLELSKGGKPILYFMKGYELSAIEALQDRSGEPGELKDRAISSQR